LGIYSLLPIGRQVFSHLQKSRVESCVAVSWEDKFHDPEFPSFLFPSAFIADHG